jgi:EAL domain-containing protein (putative c-di-GMP-specific phosphodiesterase class I)
MTRERGEAERLYLESLTATLTGWNDPEARLHQAFENNEFMLFGQSIVPLDAAKNLPSGLEILIRLHEEEIHLTPPGAFIPILEYLGMMPELDRWVVEHAAGWWRGRNGVPNTALHINLSPETLERPDFPAFVVQQLRFGGLRPDRVCFELMGSEIAAGSQESANSIESLKATGCWFAVAGFGRDLISFDALRAVGANVVKIDGAIVRELDKDPVALARLSSIQRVCSKAGVLTIAEFVEEPETLAKLRELGVDYVQGYGVAKPESLAEKSG